MVKKTEKRRAIKVQTGLKAGSSNNNPAYLKCVEDQEALGKTKREAREYCGTLYYIQ